MEKDHVKKLFSNFKQQNILVIGDVMVDAYLWGKVERISPEAPVPVVSRTHRENRLGGAANVALNLKSMGANPILCSVIGNDDKGALYIELMNEQGLEVTGIIPDNERMTTVKTRVISGSQHILRVDEEQSDLLSPDMEKELIERLFSIIDEEKIHAIIFQDYDKGVISPSLIESVVFKANKADIPTLVDPKKRNFSNYKRVTVFKPNFKEFAEGSKMDIDRNDLEALFAASRQFISEAFIRLMLITLSDKGIFVSDGNQYSLIPAHARAIADVSGAGDTVISLAALCLAAHCNPVEVAALANLAGGQVCEKVGVVPVDPDQLQHEARELEIKPW